MFKVVATIALFPALTSPVTEVKALKTYEPDMVRLIDAGKVTSCVAPEASVPVLTTKLLL